MRKKRKAKEESQRGRIVNELDITEEQVMGPLTPEERRYVEQRLVQSKGLSALPLQGIPSSVSSAVPSPLSEQPSSSSASAAAAHSQGVYRMAGSGGGVMPPGQYGMAAPRKPAAPQNLKRLTTPAAAAYPPPLSSPGAASSPT